jgi:hypothetical protein
MAAGLDHDHEESEHEHEHDDEVVIDLVVANQPYVCEAEPEEEVYVHGKSDAEKWGYTMLAVTIVTSITLIGIVFLRTSLVSGQDHKLLHNFSALASGALIGGAFFHMLPEATRVVLYSVPL